MARPSFLICDADAIAQFLLVREIRPLQTIRNSYKIQPLVVQEVELELRSHRKLAPKISHELTRLIVNGVIQVLDRAVLSAHFGSPPSGPLAAIQAMAQIEKLGQDLYRHADLGEAYTHAAALTLDVPAMSHDKTALDALIHAGHAVPKTVLRAFDLLVLAFQIGHISLNDCDQMRADLLKEGELLPRAFNNKSFLNGLSGFCPRLQDSKHPKVGGTELSPSAFANVIIL